MSLDPATADAGSSVTTLIDAWALMTRRFSGHLFAEEASVTTTFANRPLAFFNLSTLNRPLLEPASFQAALGVARVRAGACEYSSFLALCGDWAPPGWEDLAAEAGWLRSMPLVGMAADGLLPSRRPDPALGFGLVDDVARALDLGLVNALAYAMPPDTFACVGEMPLWRGDSFGVVGYEDGRPVTCAATFLVGDIIYVAMVASAPGCSGRGYAEAAMRRAIHHAEQAVGRRQIWLHATAAGLPLYRAMGFAAGAEIVLLHLASPEGGV